MTDLPPETAHRGTEHVLLVEDELLVREVLTEMLESEGYTVTSTDDPEDALDLSASGGEFDVLITDLDMPKLDGHKLAAELAVRSPRLKVIFISGYTSAATRQGLLEEDVAFLQKPFTISDLAAKVREVLDRP